MCGECVMCVVCVWCVCDVCVVSVCDVCGVCVCDVCGACVCVYGLRSTVVGVHQFELSVQPPEVTKRPLTPHTTQTYPTYKIAMLHCASVCGPDLLTCV